VAAVGLPVLAGALFDRSGSHASTVWVASGWMCWACSWREGCRRG